MRVSGREKNQRQPVFMTFEVTNNFQYLLSDTIIS